MFAAFVDISTMKLSVASGKTYLTIGSVLSVKPVSYTHLDVYKRQVLTCPIWNLSAMRSVKPPQNTVALIFW